MALQWSTLRFAGLSVLLLLASQAASALDVPGRQVMSQGYNRYNPVIHTSAAVGTVATRYRTSQASHRQLQQLIGHEAPDAAKKVAEGTVQILGKLFVNGVQGSIDEKFYRDITSVGVSTIGDLIAPGGGAVANLILDLFWPSETESLWDQIKEQAIAEIKSLINEQENENTANELLALQDDFQNWVEHANSSDAYGILRSVYTETRHVKRRFSIQEKDLNSPDFTRTMRGIQYLAPYTLLDLLLIQQLVNHWVDVSKTRSLTAAEAANIPAYNKDFADDLTAMTATLHAARLATRRWAKAQLQVNDEVGRGSYTFSISNPRTGATWRSQILQANRDEGKDDASNRLLALQSFLMMENTVDITNTVDKFLAAEAGWLLLMPGSNPARSQFANVPTPTYWQSDMFGYKELYSQGGVENLDSYAFVMSLVTAFSVIPANSSPKEKDVVSEDYWIKAGNNNITKVVIADGKNSDGKDVVKFLKFEYTNGIGQQPPTPQGARVYTLRPGDYITIVHVCQDGDIGDDVNGLMFFTNNGSRILGGRNLEKNSKCKILTPVAAPDDFGSVSNPPRMHAMQAFMTDYVKTVRFYFRSKMNIPTKLQ